MANEKVVDKNAPPGTKPGDDETKTALDGLKTANQELVNQNTEMRTQLDGLQNTIMSPQYQEFVESQKNKPGQFDKGSFASGGGQVDLETLDRNQFTQHLMGIVEKMVGNVSKKQDQRIGQLDTSLQKEQLRRSIDSARGLWNDFDTHTAEMSKISLRIEREGGVSADDLYRIATHPGPGKPPGQEDTTEVEKPGGAAAAIKPPENETPRQAAERVYDEIMGNKG